MKSKLSFLTAIGACLAFAAALFFADIQLGLAGPPGPHPGGGGGPRPAAPRPSAPRPSAPRPSAPRPSRPTPNVRPSTPHTPHPGNMGHPSGPGKINPGHPSTGPRLAPGTRPGKMPPPTKKPVRPISTMLPVDRLPGGFPPPPPRPGLLPPPPPVGYWTYYDDDSYDYVSPYDTEAYPDLQLLGEYEVLDDDANPSGWLVMYYDQKTKTIGGYFNPAGAKKGTVDKVQGTVKTIEEQEVAWFRINDGSASTCFASLDNLVNEDQISGMLRQMSNKNEGPVAKVFYLNRIK